MERGKNQFTKSQRMKLKGLICVLGLLLIVLLLIAAVIKSYIDRENGKSHYIEKEHILPEIKLLKNAWIMESNSSGLQVFFNGEEVSLSFSDMLDSFVERTRIREQVADIELTDGIVTGVRVKRRKINGRVLSADSDAVQLEEYGTIPLAEDYKGYRLYRELQSVGYRDLLFGYNYADYVMDGDEICAILLAKEEKMENIRVLLMTDDFGKLLHDRIVVTSDVPYTLYYGLPSDPKSETFQAGELLTIEKDSPYFEGDNTTASGNHITIKPSALTGKITVKNIKRHQGKPSYRGFLEIKNTDKGMAVLNEVPLEEYLYSVVPSEMPSGYPKEALKTQAICARTYAYGLMLHAGYPQYGAHVNDSVAYQVYNNVTETETTTTAVKETYGQLLWFPGDNTPAETYFYSTSCGVGTDANVWKGSVNKSLQYLHGKELTKKAIAAEMETGVSNSNSGLMEGLQDNDTFSEFIRKKDPEAFEVNEVWYRWTYDVKKINPERIRQNLTDRYQSVPNLILTRSEDGFVSEPIQDFEKITNITMQKRGLGGVGDELLIETDKGSYLVIAEYNIRYVLNNGDTNVILNNGKTYTPGAIIPSAYITIDLDKKDGVVTGYHIIGGGMGHGVGMSQVGTKYMAQEGYNCSQILNYFYDDCMILNAYEDLPTAELEEGQ